MPTTSSTTTASPADATTSLAARSGFARPSVVRAGSGYEAATVSGSTGVTFWTGDGRTWRPAGSSTHPAIQDGATEPIKIAGARLAGADHAMFVLEGSFTGDGTGQALAYGRTGSAWSTYAAAPDSSLAPSGHGMPLLSGGNGLELSMSFNGGRFRTSSLWARSSTASYAEQTSHPIVRTWRASGARLLKVSDNVLTARSAAAPTLPNVGATRYAGTGLADGAWPVVIDSVDTDGTLTVRPARTTGCAAPEGFCVDPSARTVRIGVPASMVTTVPSWRGQTPGYVTAPGWMLQQLAASATQGEAPPDVSGLRAGSSYVVPASVADHLEPVSLTRLTISGGRVSAAALVLRGG